MSKKTIVDSKHYSVRCDDIYSNSIDPNSLDIGLLRELLETNEKKTWVKGHFSLREGLITRVSRDPDGTFLYSVIFENGNTMEVAKEGLIDDPGELVKELWEK